MNWSTRLPLPNLDHSTKVLIIGHGRFGRHLEEMLHDKAPCLKVGCYEPGPRYIGDGSFHVRDYDVIVLAVPIREYEKVIQDIVPRMKESTVIVDIATVKAHTVRLLEKHATGCYWVATHPMWGPESYKKTEGDVSGYRLVVVKHTLPKLVFERIRGLVAATGIEVVRMTPAHHDGHLAQTLFLTHFIGQTVTFAGFNRTEIDTVSFGYLMNAAESVRNDIELFLDVYRHNRRLCADVLRRIEKAMHEVRLVLEGEND